MSDQQQGAPRGRRGRGQQDLSYRPRSDGQGFNRGGHAGPSRGRGGGSYNPRGGGGGAPSGPVAVFSPGYPAVEDSARTRREDELLASSGVDNSVTLPRRPAYGTKGTKVLLWANYFHLSVKKEMVLHRYDVKVTATGGGRAPPTAIVKRIIVLFIEDHLRPRNLDAVSDLRATLVSRQQLDEPASSADVTYRAEGEPLPEDDARVFKVQLIHNGTLTLDNLLNHTTSTNASAAFRYYQEFTQALNLVVGYHPKTSPASFSVGRNLHVSSAVAQEKADLTGGFEALRSFVFSVRAATERVLINVQIKPIAFHSAGPLSGIANANRSNPRQFLSIVNRISVEVTHIRRTSKSGRALPRYKTIFGLASPGDGKNQAHPPQVARNGAGPKEVSFWLDAEPAEEGSSKGKKAKKGKAPGAPGPGDASKGSAGRYITVFDFFSARYPRYNISDPTLPVINVGTKSDPSYLPVDVCIVRPGQVVRSQLAPSQSKHMLNFAVRQPSANASSIVNQGFSLLGLQGANTYMPSFGMTVEPQLITVLGRVLSAPSITYDKKTLPVRSASWNLSNSKLLRGVALSDWAILTISDERSDPQPTATAMADFRSQLRNIGIVTSVPSDLGELHVGGGNLDRIEARIKEAFLASDRRLKFLLVLMPENTAIYSKVKYVCDVQGGILCQCVVRSKFLKANNAQYFANVGMKVNLKLGGVNHGIQKSQFGNISLKTTMFVGIDVTHPSPGSAPTAPSVAGIVSSVDDVLGQWPAALRIQTARQEMVDALDELLQGQLRLWSQRNNNTLPKNIIVYRDGVSEGQYQLLLEKELPSLQKAINTIYTPGDKAKYAPQLSIIVVGKRHHTRFYPTKSNDMDAKTGNTVNGTVVDRGVTDVGNWDFFLQAHSALKGTAKPAHYYVIYDEALRGTGPNRQTQGGAADNLEELTHSLCYLFGRATKAVSICPPAYYADLVCERARCYLAQHYAPSPPTSSAVSVASDAGGAMATMRGLINVNARVKDKMFYI